MHKAILTITGLALCSMLAAQSRPIQTGTKPQVHIPAMGEPLPIRNSDTLTLAFIGDVMMHEKQLGHAYGRFLEDLSPGLRNAGIAIANAEFTLAGPPYSGYPAFSSPDSYATVLRDSCGIDVFLTANNHILDKGGRGLVRTLGVYDSLGVSHTGSARSPEEFEARHPLLLFASGIRIALVNFTYGTNLGPGNSPYSKVARMNREEVAASIRKAKEAGADLVIALPHWGTEYVLTHSESQEDWAKWMASQGADLIVGTHPHVVQDSSVIAGVPVFYSLGNSVSNMSARNTRLGIMLEVKIVKNQASGTLETIEPTVHFTWCTLPGTLTPGYKTIKVKEWAGRRSDWLTPSDYDNMMETLQRVCTATGIACPL